MLKKILFIVPLYLLISSCVKDEDPTEQYYWQSDLDQQIIQLYMMTHKMDAENLELVETEFNDPECIWNKRLSGELQYVENYTDLLGAAFLDTNKVSTMPNGTGVWVLIASEGKGDENPTDSSYIRVQYELSLGEGDVISEMKYGEFPLKSGVVTGFKYGMTYFKNASLYKTINDEGEEVYVWDGPGQGWIFVPSRSGYGATSSGVIPANSVLLFKVKLDGIAELPPAES